MIKNEGDIDKFIDAEINAFSVSPVLAGDGGEAGAAPEGEPLLDEGYPKESWVIAQYISSGLKRPAGLSRAEHRALWSNAFLYCIEDGKLY